jgi:hypothetical protein
VATGIDNTGVARQPQAEEGALTNLAEKLRHNSNRIADRNQQDSSVRPMPITPSLPGPAQAEPSMASIAAAERLQAGHEPTQNEIRAAQRKARDESYPDKRGRTLMQRLASVGLGRTEPNDARNSIDQDSLDIPAYLRRQVAT